MTPQQKFDAMVTVITVLIMYLLLVETSSWLINLNFTHSILNTLVGWLSSGLLTVGLYTLLSKVLNSLFVKWIWLKKIFLGASDLNGTWLGKFTTNEDEVKLTVETFEQSLNSILIRGTAYNQDKTIYATWTSVSVDIDVKNGKLTYAYECDVCNESGSHDGIARFSFHRMNSRCSPSEISGYSSDLKTNEKAVKFINFEKRISHEVLLPELAKNIVFTDNWPTPNTLKGHS